VIRAFTAITAVVGVGLCAGTALAGGAIALQLLTVGLVHQAGTNPDRIRREEDTYREAADIASASFPI